MRVFYKLLFCCSQYSKTDTCDGISHVHVFCLKLQLRSHANGSWSDLQFEPAVLVKTRENHTQLPLRFVRADKYLMTP